MKTKNLVLISICAVIISSCATISYTPKVSLDLSPLTIKKTIKAENLIDKTKPEHKKKPISGFSVTDSESLAGDLSTEVTNAIIEDFNNNGVFSKISKREDNPDFILKGEITNFEGKYRPTTIYWVTIPVSTLWFFGIPIAKDEIDIDLKVTIYKRSGEFVGEYYGEASDTQLYTLYKNGAFGLPAKTNRIFSDAIKQIREKIIQDAGKFNN